MKPCEQHGLNVLRYLDNELRGQELEEFSAHLQTCVDCKSRLEEERALSSLLHESRPLYSAPAELRARVSQAVDQRSHEEKWRDRFEILRHRLRSLPLLFSNWKMLTLAVLSIIVICSFLPGTVRQVRAADYVATAVATHRSYLDGSLPLEIESDSPEVVTAWFAAKVPFHFQLPASQAALKSKPAYRLTGARLVHYKDRHAALVAYATQKEIISLLVAPSTSAVVAGGDEVQSGNLTFHYHSEAGLSVITWANHGLSYALVSSLSGSARQSCMVCHENLGDLRELIR